jgi:hypothetical protein
MLNVCNGIDWPVKGDGIAPHDTFALGDPRSVGGVWQRCDEMIAPLAAREILAVAVFLRWINTMPRLAERNFVRAHAPTPHSPCAICTEPRDVLDSRNCQFLGPIMLTVRFMVWDTLKFLVLMLWIVLAWAIFFYMLFREPYGRSNNLPDSCAFDPDNDFTSLLDVVIILWEATLDGTGHFGCFTASSESYLATSFMYIFVLTSTILLVNMLIGG